MSTRLTCIADALECCGLSQRDVATHVKPSQAKISRISRDPWSKLDHKLVIEIFEGICKLLTIGEFTIIGMGVDKVSAVYYDSAKPVRVIFHPYRPNEC